MSMAVQTLYLLADLYWVGHLGKEAIAAVGVAGNVTMIVLALTQMLGVGTTTSIAQAAGRKDQVRAELVFNQSFVMSIVIAFALGIVGFLLRPVYCDWLSADATTATLAKAYLLWFLPGLLLQFPLVALGSALRATGIIKPAVGFQVLSVLLNIVLAPLLIFGIGPWPKLGVTGAALATFISILVADVLMVIYFEKKYHYLRFRFPLFRPRTKIWSGMLSIGVPAGAEFMLLFVYILLVYAIIRGFGPAAQAGFGIGARVMQALFFTGGGAKLCCVACGGPELWRPSRRPGPPICLFRDRHRVADDAGPYVDRVPRAGNTDSHLLARSASDRVRQRISSDCVSEFRVGRSCLCNFQRFSGNRQYATTVV
jgi:MATE family, multidrug efflux pump